MAIADRNLTPGTKLWARYKGGVYTAEVVAQADGQDNQTIAYRLTLNGEPKDYKSPSAAGAAIMGPNRTCNGWAFWSVGEPVEKPAKAERAPKSTSVNAVPKPERKKRERKSTTANGEPVPTDGNGHALPIIEQTDNRFECGECGASFETSDEAAAHIAELHPA
jgi:hypothetical protein